MQENDSKIYEVGFHLVPFLSEEQVLAETAEIKATIEKNGGEVFHEEAPKLRPLAYEIATVTNGVKRNHDQAYFGFIKFNGSAEKADAIKTALDKKDTIIRFILIKTIKDNTMYGNKAARIDGPRGKKTKDEEGKDGVPSPLTEAEMDKTIDELVIE